MRALEVFVADALDVYNLQEARDWLDKKAAEHGKGDWLQALLQSRQVRDAVAFDAALREAVPGCGGVGGATRLDVSQGWVFDDAQAPDDAYNIHGARRRATAFVDSVLHVCERRYGQPHPADLVKILERHTERLVRASNDEVANALMIKWRARHTFAGCDQVTDVGVGVTMATLVQAYADMWLVEVDPVVRLLERMACALHFRSGSGSGVGITSQKPRTALDVMRRSADTLKVLRAPAVDIITGFDVLTGNTLYSSAHQKAITATIGPLEALRVGISRNNYLWRTDAGQTLVHLGPLSTIAAALEPSSASSDPSDGLCSPTRSRCCGVGVTSGSSSAVGPVSALTRALTGVCARIVHQENIGIDILRAVIPRTLYGRIVSITDTCVTMWGGAGSSDERQWMVSSHPPEYSSADGWIPSIVQPSSNQKSHQLLESRNGWIPAPDALFGPRDSAAAGLEPPPWLEPLRIAMLTSVCKDPGGLLAFQQFVVRMAHKKNLGTFKASVPSVQPGGASVQPVAEVVAIDTRPNVWTALSMLLAMENLKDDDNTKCWGATVYCAEDAASFYRNCLMPSIPHLVIRVFPPHVLDGMKNPKGVFDIEGYNRLLKSKWFWEPWRDSCCKCVLLVQDDGVLLRPGLSRDQRFFVPGAPGMPLRYEYVGAPWTETNHELKKLVPCVVGNGGLSLRNPRAMYEIAERAEAENTAPMLFNQRHQPIPEDVFFAKACLDRGGLAPTSVGHAFAFEMQAPPSSELPYGFHKPWPYHPTHVIDSAYSAYLDAV